MTKQVFIAGGSGRVATDLISDLVGRGYDVVAGARHEDNIIEMPGVARVHLDLHSEVEDIAHLMEGSDAVYFTAGSRGKDLLQTDAFGAVKVMKAAERVGIKRFIMLSSLFALEPEKWTKVESLESIMDYNIAKYFADNYLIYNTNLKYTILQPSVLTEEEATGKISIDVEVGKEIKPNPIPDVARTLADILEYNNTADKVIKMAGGNTPIEEALASIK